MLVLLSGCRGSDTEPLVLLPKKPNASPIPLGSESLDFSSLKKNVFNRCIGCHDQYKNHDGVRRELAAIKDSIRLNRMPKSGSRLDAEQKDLLNRWIQEGAPEFSDMTTQPIYFPPLEPTWKSIYDGLIAPKCLVCHNPNGQAKFLDFSNRDAVYSQKNRTFGGVKLIDFENPDDSYIIQILTDKDEPMPPIWSNISLLSDDERKVFSQWLALGLP